MSRQPDNEILQLLDLLRRPCELTRLTPFEWDSMLVTAQQLRLIGRIAHEAATVELNAPVPQWLDDRLMVARLKGQEHARRTRWEINRIQRATRDAGVAPIFLKGAAYVAMGLPFAAGRLSVDVDVLVSREHLPATERALLDWGWVLVEQTPYDERYYREWVHELPPMQHRQRRTVVDVHHAILPPTGRLHPPTSRLVERSVDVNGVRVPCPSHLVLHAAVHTFQDGELAGALRDIVDIDGLLTHFGREPAFWDDLLAEADQLGLVRPLYYAVRYAERLCRTQVPPSVVQRAGCWAPSPLVLRAMDALVDAALLSRRGPLSGVAVFALYVRAHWLRMPPLMLVRHLLHQAVAR